MTTALAGIPAVVLYITAGVMLGRRLAHGGFGRLPPKTVAMAFAGVAVLVHAAVLYSDLFTTHGLNMGFFNSLSLAGWLVAAMVLLLTFRKPVESLGIALLPFAAVTLVLQLTFASDPDQVIEADARLQFHILLAVLAYGTLTIAAFQAVLLWLQDRQLHNRRPGGLVQALPPLQTMEELLFQMIGIGFFLLSLALVTGVLFLEDIFAQALVHKTVLSFAAWGVFGTLLWGRHRFGWRGRTALRWTLWGFGALALAYFGSKLVLELILHR
jgi:ABC-type uncharacterized transport system permease subunit